MICKKPLAIKVPANKAAGIFSLSKKIIKITDNTRSINKSDLKLNNRLPNISVDPQTYEVFSDGELLTCEPLDQVPMAQRYFLL